MPPKAPEGPKTSKASKATKVKQVLKPVTGVHWRVWWPKVGDDMGSHDNVFHTNDPIFKDLNAKQKTVGARVFLPFNQLLYPAVLVAQGTYQKMHDMEVNENNGKHLDPGVKAVTAKMRLAKNTRLAQNRELKATGKAGDIEGAEQDFARSIFEPEKQKASTSTHPPPAAANYASVPVRDPQDDIELSGTWTFKDVIQHISRFLTPHVTAENYHCLESLAIALHSLPDNVSFAKWAGDIVTGLLPDMKTIINQESVDGFQKPLVLGLPKAYFKPGSDNMVKVFENDSLFMPKAHKSQLDTFISNKHDWKSYVGYLMSRLYGRTLQFHTAVGRGNTVGISRTIMTNLLTHVQNNFDSSVTKAKLNFFVNHLSQNKRRSKKRKIADGFDDDELDTSSNSLGKRTGQDENCPPPSSPRSPSPLVFEESGCCEKLTVVKEMEKQPPRSTSTTLRSETKDKRIVLKDIQQQAAPITSPAQRTQTKNSGNILKMKGQQPAQSSPKKTPEGQQHQRLGSEQEPCSFDASSESYRHDQSYHSAMPSLDQEKYIEFLQFQQWKMANYSFAFTAGSSPMSVQQHHPVANQYHQSPMPIQPQHPAANQYHHSPHASSSPISIQDHHTSTHQDHHFSQHLSYSVQQLV